MMKKYIMVFALLLAALALWRAEPARAATPTYTTTVTSNITATLGCVWGWDMPACLVACTDCTEAVCTSLGTFTTVGVCIETTNVITSYQVATSSPYPHSELEGDKKIYTIWSGTSYQGAQSADYTLVAETSGGSGSTDLPMDWTLPTEPLRPFFIGTPEANHAFSFRITPQNMWDVARTALTAYTIISWDNSQTWVVFAAILLLPLAGLIIYRLLSHPPEI